MSEYQYYEFQTVDRPLTPSQMAELRQISSRAKITPTRFQNSYSYGDFGGEPLDLVAEYFDAHVYVANWGSYTLLLGFPIAAVNVEQLKQYAVEAFSGYVSGLTVHERGDRVVVDFSYAGDEGSGWIDEDDAAGWLPSLIQLRSDMLNGDLRAIYLGWLAGATVNMLEFAGMDEDDLDEEEAERLGSVEPPVPPGLTDLTPPLQTLVRFLQIDEGLVAVAAEASEPLTADAPNDAEIAAWIAQLAVDEKDRLLHRIVAGDASVGIELRSRMRAEQSSSGSPSEVSAARRTVRELLMGGRDRAVEIGRQEEAAKKQARQEYLNQLADREAATWTQVEALINQRQGHSYDDAVRLLRDLHDLAEWRNDRSACRDRIALIAQRHRQKPSLIDRLRKAALI